MNKQSVINVAKHFNGIVSETEYNCYDQSYQFYIDAPDRKVWMDGGTSFFMVIWFRYDSNKDEQFKDAIERMQYGLEDINI